MIAPTSTSRHRGCQAVQGDAALPVTQVNQSALEQVHFTYEFRHERVRRPRVGFRGRGDLLDAAAVEHHDAVGQGHGLDLITRKPDAGDEPA
jgi:hypothetical protein